MRAAGRRAARPRGARAHGGDARPPGPDDQRDRGARERRPRRTRLAIVDPGPSGHQPMWDPSGRCLLAFNGEVYNHRELRDELPGVAWRGHGDTETLAAALAEWGEGAVERATARWPSPRSTSSAGDCCSRATASARSRCTSRATAAGCGSPSEIEALLAAGVPGRRPPRRPRPHGGTRAGRCGRGPRSRRRPPPARHAPHDRPRRARRVASAAGTRPATPSTPSSPASSRRCRAEQLVDRLEEALRASVRARLMADVPRRDDVLGRDRLLADHRARARGARRGDRVDLLAGRRARGRRAPLGRAGREALGVDLETVGDCAAAWRAELVAAVSGPRVPPDQVELGADRA